MLVTVVSDDAPWRAALEDVLRQRGFRILSLPEAHVPLPLAPRPLALLLDAHVAPHGAAELGAQLRVFIEGCPPLVCLGTPDEGHDEEIFDAWTERPADPADLTEELVRLLPRLAGMASGMVTRARVRDLVDSETG